MSDSRKKIIPSRLAESGLAAQSGLLGAIVAIVAVPLALVAYTISGSPGAVAAVAAGGACLLGGEAALVLCQWLAGRVDVMRALLVGMLARMTLPLILVLAMHFVAPSLTQGGLFIYVLAFYPVVLGTETIFALARLGQNSTSQRTT